MVKRTFWETRIRKAHARHSVVWLSGVRRVGKTTLARELSGGRYFDCELPRVRADLEDAEVFLRRLGKGPVVLDEIHRLPNPSEVLKIAADHFPGAAVIATGSSTLAARSKFRDSLTGRKSEVWLTPMIGQDLVDFGLASPDPDRRMLHGGLPPFFLGEAPDDAAFAEWVDSYWAKDLQELFVVEKKSAFFQLVELLFRQSGGLFEAQSFTRPCELARQTVHNYLEILETTLLATVLRPYSGGSAHEIIQQPKVYMFDTGFTAYFRGWSALREEDRGALLEHLVLGELQARFARNVIYHWRDKQKHEVDFVLNPRRSAPLTAFECKVSWRAFDPAGLTSFRNRYPTGRNFLICLDATATTTRRIGTLEMEIVPYLALGDLLDAL